MDLQRYGEMSERFKEHAWKACVGETRPWVRIPPSPPCSLLFSPSWLCSARMIDDAAHNAWRLRETACTDSLECGVGPSWQIHCVRCRRGVRCTSLNPTSDIPDK